MLKTIVYFVTPVNVDFMHMKQRKSDNGV